MKNNKKDEPSQKDLEKAGQSNIEDYVKKENKNEIGRIGI